MRKGGREGDSLDWRPHHEIMRKASAVVDTAMLELPKTYLLKEGC